MITAHVDGNYLPLADARMSPLGRGLLTEGAAASGFVCRGGVLRVPPRSP